MIDREFELKFDFDKPSDTELADEWRWPVVVTGEMFNKPTAQFAMFVDALLTEIRAAAYAERRRRVS